jgi:hypothetical protein
LVYPYRAQPLAGPAKRRCQSANRQFKVSGINRCRFIGFAERFLTLLHSINARFEELNAHLLSAGSSPDVIEQRLYLTKRIGLSYPAFEVLRDALMGRRNLELTPTTKPFLQTMEDYGIVTLEKGAWQASDGDARRYLSGGWLEEYVAAAAKEAGADEVLCGQKIAWEAGGYRGENEIDVLARFGQNLFFCSCKALKSHLAPHDDRTRERLTAALHEADNLADHFGPSGAVVALAVTTDLINEQQGFVRYEPFHGKAAALNVNILSAEKLVWKTLVREIRGYFPPA